MMPEAIETCRIGASSIEFGERHHGARLGLRAFQHLEEAEFLADVIHHEAQHEAVVERGEFVLVGQFVRRAEHRDERDLHALAAVVKDALVDDGQQRIEDRGVGLEDFVQERDVRLGQLVHR